MLATLTREQQSLREVADRIASAAAPHSPSDVDAVDRDQVWGRLVEAGLLSLRLREDGLPVASGTEARLVAEALARSLVPVPFLGCTLAMELLALAGADPSLADGIADGRTRGTIALTADLSGPATAGDGGALAWDAEGADWCLALGARADEGVEVVRVRIPQGSARPSGTDLTRQVAKVSWDDAEVAGRVSGDELVRWESLACALVSADAVGAMRGTLDHAVAYSKERIAYGAPIGSYQALQHLMVDAYVKTECAASLATYAAWAVDEEPAPAALLAGHSANAYASEVGTDVGETAMQVFGGIGQTWEHIAHVYTRRLVADRLLFGTAQALYRKVADERLVVS